MTSSVNKIKEFKGNFLPIKKKIAIVVSEFNGHITQMLYQGSVQTLIDRGTPPENINTYWVPGAYEIPLTCKKVLGKKVLDKKKIVDKNQFDGIIALGVIIKGETPHFDYVAANTAQGIAKVSLEFSKPIILGVLTTDTVEQALNRSGIKFGNKGSEAAHSLLNLLTMYQAAELL